jgi:D-alanine-D-alanine ligase
MTAGAKLRVGLLFGGRSVEHEVSVISARSVAAAFEGTDLICVPLAVTDRGRWLTPEASREIFESQAARVDDDAIGDSETGLLLGPAKGLLQADGVPLQTVAVDVLFPLLHGWGGEDGRLQGALDWVQLPYVGAGLLGSAVAMDKAVAKHLCEAHGVPVVPWLLCRRGEFDADPAGAESRAIEALGFPLFVKPSNGGSSVGVSRVEDPESLTVALTEAFRYDRRVVVEQAVAAREIECAVLGNDDPEASGLGEIVVSREFYDYADKYLDGTSELLIPAPLEAAVTARIREAALEAYRALDVAGFARVDFLLERETGEIYFNELNTLPGFTPISMFPRLWEAAGLPYPALIERLVELAFDRAGHGTTTLWRPSGG